MNAEATSTSTSPHDKRKQADYDIPYPKIEKEIPALLEIAKEFALSLNSLDKRLPENRGVKN